MKIRAWTISVLAALAASALAPAARADGRNPGSLLVFPEFDNTQGRATLLTLTNVNPDVEHGTVRVEIVFIDATNEASPSCTETNATITLTPNDTFTFLASALNPNSQRGYAYAFAKDAEGRAIAFDWLIGDDLLFDGVSTFDYSINPYAFRAMRGFGQPTDVDNDGLRDLNGIEYEAAPDRIIVPRFLGQSPAFQSQLVLINLTGGAQFNASVHFLVYNDNEEVFSKDFEFRCWTRRPLLAIANTFDQNFLASYTTHAPNEMLGLPALETGWFEMNGGIAYSTSAQFVDPAILGFLIERSGPYGGAELAFDMGRQTNGDLLPLGPMGDTN